MLYRRLSFLLPPAAEEPLTARLWSLGTLGLEILEGGLELTEGAGERLRIDAWFAEPAAALDAGWPAEGVELVESVAVEERDWMEAYRRHARPILVGSRIVVDPRDEAEPPSGAGDRLWLHLPARRAFGTGGHASTRLAVELLERLPLAGRSVLDLGTGSGLLAFAALAGGARRVVALDRDPVATLVAGENRARNRLWPALAAGGVDCLAAGPRFDLALVNIEPRLVAADLPALVGLLAPGADALFSGWLESERRSREARLGELGLEIVGRRRDGDWAAVHARSGAGS